MLSTVDPPTPRPKPPAKVRRASSARIRTSPPPPPYRFPADEMSQPTLETFLGSPVSMTAQMLGYFASQNPGAIPEEWSNIKSREELRELLARAEETIKVREGELGLTSEFIRSLYQENMSMKTNHDALMSRIPTSRSQSPDLTASSPPMSPAYHASSPSGTFSDMGSPTPSTSASTLSGYRRTRRISISPADISLLTEQNAELLSKLEHLEEESHHADLAGKRKLRKLEKEIQGMKDELERTQVRSAELEERTRTVLEKEGEMRRREREEKVSAIKAKTGMEDSVDAHDLALDFSPGGALCGTTQTPVKTQELPAWPFPVSRTASTSAAEADVFSAPAVKTPENEYELISQLLSKIRELEETNIQIARQQMDTSMKLRVAQRDSHNIKRLYDVLKEEPGVDLEIVVEEDNGPRSPTKSDSDESTSLSPNTFDRNKTIRFKSLRRTIERDSAKLRVADDNIAFAEGITDASTNRGIVPPHKSRKALTGLFEDPSMTTSPGNTSASLSELSFAFPSADSPQSPSMALDAGSPMGTLGTELGPEFRNGSIWGTSGDNHHLRVTSLYDISQTSLFTMPPMSPSLVSPTSDVPLGTQLNEVEDPSQFSPPPSRPGTLRNRKLSQAVMSRSGRWKEGRLGHESAGEPSRPPLEKKKSTLRLVRAFEAAADALSSPTDAETADTCADDSFEENGEANSTAVQVRPKMGPIMETNEKKGVTEVAMEVWLWLQFAIVILVFLWAMAKRGPRSVLAEAEKRRRTTSAGSSM